MPTGTRTDFSNFLKQYSAEQQQVSNWDYLFTNMFEQQYKAGATGLEQQAQKDIAGAYGNFVASQIQLKNIDNITEGYRQSLNKSLEEAYSKSVYDTNQALSQDKASLALSVGDEIAKYKASAEKDIDKRAESMLGYENDLLKHASKIMIDDELLTDKYSELFKFDAEGNVLGFSDTGNRFMYEAADSNNPNSLTYSDQGKQFMGYLLQDFGDWAKMNYSPEKYSEFIETGYSDMNNALFGSDINPYAGDTSVISNLSDNVRYSELNSEKNSLGFDDVTSGKALSENEAKNIFSLTSINLGDTWFKGAQSVEKWILNNDPTVLKSGNARSEQVAENSKQDKMLKTLKSTSLALDKSGNTRQGDIIIIGDFLAYRTEDGFRYAPNTQEIRSKLAKAGIKIGN